MAWKETTKMKQKIELINEWRSGNYSITELCRQFEISRPTAYKYIKRYEEEGLEGLLERNRKPFEHPLKTPHEIEQQIVLHRKKYSRWGAEKIWKILHKDLNAESIPSITTINRILKRNGLVKTKKRRRRVKPVHPIFDPQSCNEVWSADFKGKFRLGNNNNATNTNVINKKATTVATTVPTVLAANTIIF